MSLAIECVPQSATVASSPVGAWDVGVVDKPACSSWDGYEDGVIRAIDLRATLGQEVLDECAVVGWGIGG